MELEWDEQKNKILQETRNISFERINVAIEEGGLLRILRHPNKDYFSHQHLLLVLIEKYVYVVPAIPTDNGFFLKLLIPVENIQRFLYKAKEFTMNENIFDPLDDEEKVLMEAIENDEFIPTDNETELKEKILFAARNTGKKDQRMNIRMSKTDMDRLKTKALQEGMPYQTLVSSVLHKYLHNSL